MEEKQIINLIKIIPLFIGVIVFLALMNIQKEIITLIGLILVLILLYSFPRPFKLENFWNFYERGYNKWIITLIVSLIIAVIIFIGGYFFGWSPNLY